MHVLISGASGFLGSYLVRALQRDGHLVTVLVRSERTAPPDTRALSYTLGSAEPLKFPDGIEAVVHLAQSRAYRAFPGDADEMFRVNVMGTQALLQAAAASRQVKHFCFVSSGAVYEPFAGPLREDACVMPPSYLGASKLAAETVARPFGALFPLSMLRLFAPYGAGQTGRLVPDLVQRVREGRAVQLPESGDGMTFAPTHVDDICRLILDVLSDSWVGTWNVAAREAVTIRKAAEIIGTVMGRRPVFEKVPSLSQPVVVPDLTKLATRYDLSRFRTFEQGLASMTG